MSDFLIIHTGIFFNAIVSGIVAVTATALSIFLMRRWRQLSPAMKAYGWFWSMTALIWLPSSLRYLLISSGHTNEGTYILAVLSQLAVAASGTTLLMYLGRHLNLSQGWAVALPVIASVGGAIALWADLQPDGIIFQPTTYFSAEIALNKFSLSIFLFIVMIIFFLVMYDIGHYIVQYRTHRDNQLFYEALYSMAVAIYLILGSIEEVGAISNWTVIVFRSLYVATFLIVFLIMKKSESIAQNFIIDTRTAGPYR